jgi:hypothetical protein
MNSINTLSEIFETIATNHPVIQGFYTHRLDELDAGKITIDKYPLLYAQVTGLSADNGMVEFEFELIVADYVIEEEEPNLTSVYNDTFLILMDVVNEFVMSAVSSQVNIDASVDLPLLAQPFTARFANILTGWSMDLRIRTPFPINLCDVKYNA